MTTNDVETGKILQAWEIIRASANRSSYDRPA